MKNGKLIMVIVFIMVISGCATSKISRRENAEGFLIPNGPAWAALWQQRSAEYKALCLQSYNIAKEKLDSYLSQSNIPMPAVVTDVDETVLDNSPYTVHQALKGQLYSDSSWMEWTARTECDTVPGALSFLTYAASRGVKVFYVTNRLEAERNATLADLQKWRFPFADNDHLLMKTKSSSKDERRSSVAANHTILLLLGDNLGDFTGIFDHQSYQKRDSLVRNNISNFGNRFIVLPNAMYGEWQGALLDYNYRLSKEQQNAALMKWLKNY